MTGSVSIFLALVGGQGVSPPNTVTQFPGLISYFVVQAIILAFTLLAADQIRLLRLRRTGETLTRPTAGSVRRGGWSRASLRPRSSWRSC